MEEVVLSLDHGLPFNNVSRLFPKEVIYRWCNSRVGYLEFRPSDPSDVGKMLEGLEDLVKQLGSRLLFTSQGSGLLTAMVACRCSNQNSTVRMAEGMYCLWKAPVSYEHGKERLTVFSPENRNFGRLYDSLSSLGAVEIIRKSRLKPSALRDSYTVSLSGIPGGMTEKQAGHLVAAAASGYFAIPKVVTLGALARKEGVTESTLQEHISKAESKLMASLTPYIRLYLSFMPGRGCGRFALMHPVS